MSKLIGILGLVLTLATMIVAPVQDVYAADAVTTSPMMQMADGVPCTPQGCAKMPDCPMALPCLSVPLADIKPSAKSLFQPVVQILRFALSADSNLSSVDGSGLRRPPKI